MQIKKAFIPLLFGSIITCGGVLTSCSKPKNFSVNWRTEDLEWTVGNPLMSKREWIWITPPNVFVNHWGLDDGSILPEGIGLNPNGQLVGTPTKACDLYVKFTCIANGYKTQVSKPIHFIIYPQGVNVPSVGWTDMNFQRNIALPADTKIYNSSPSITGGKFRIRQGYNLPNGLTLNEDTGVLSGTPDTPNRWSISFDYYSPSGTFETNVSDVYHIYVYYKHNLNMKLSGPGSSFSSIHPNRFTSNDLATSINSVSSDLYNSFDVFTTFLQNNHYDNYNYLEATGNLVDTLFPTTAIAYRINGIGLRGFAINDVALSFDQNHAPGFQVDFFKSDFKSITDTIAP